MIVFELCHTGWRLPWKGGYTGHNTLREDPPPLGSTPPPPAWDRIQLVLTLLYECSSQMLGNVFMISGRRCCLVQLQCIRVAIPLVSASVKRYCSLLLLLPVYKCICHGWVSGSDDLYAQGCFSAIIIFDKWLPNLLFCSLKSICSSPFWSLQLIRYISPQSHGHNNKYIFSSLSDILC